MSGGSHNYICYRIQEDLCGCMKDRELDDLVFDIAELAHDLEWWDSADMSEETYREHVRRFKAKWFKADREARLKGYVNEAVENLRKELHALIGGD